MNTPSTTTATELALLETILGTGQWMHARDIHAHWRWQQQFPAMRRDIAERKIRALSNYSAGSILSYPGSPGYRLRAAATIEEVQTAIAKLKHQGTEMMARADAIERFGQTTSQLQLV